MRQLSSKLFTTALSVRFFTPSKEIKKLYESDFAAGKFPLDLPASDSAVFAKFLFRSAEANNSTDSILNDFKTIDSIRTTLPLFWERSANLDSIEGFKKLSEPTLFTLYWMQSNMMLDSLQNVRSIFEAYANEKAKRCVATITVGDSKKDTAAIATAKNAAKELQQEKKDIANFTLVFDVRDDPQLVEGYTVELAGSFLMRGTGREVKTAAVAQVIDYLDVAEAATPTTRWTDSLEVDILRPYLLQLAALDEEEAIGGV